MREYLIKFNGCPQCRKEILYIIKNSSVGMGEFYHDDVMWGGTGWEILSQGKPLIQGYRKNSSQFKKEYGFEPPPIFAANSIDSIYKNLLELYDNFTLREKNGQLSLDWFIKNNAHVAAKKIIDLLEQKRKGTMKIFMQTPIDEIKIKNHTISHIDYFNFLDKKTTISDKLRLGLSGSSLFGKLRNPEYINKLYLSNDPGYIKYLNEFKDRYHDFDVIVMNPGVDLVHPEFLYKNFSDSIKCLHFIDDPHTTYSYGLPFSWVFDCATYISPSYNFHFTMEEILKLAGFKKTKWMPHCVTNIDKPKYRIKELEKQLLARNNKAIYVGSYYSGKNQRLIHLKKSLKKFRYLWEISAKRFLLPFVILGCWHPASIKSKKYFKRTKR